MSICFTNVGIWHEYDGYFHGHGKNHSDDRYYSALLPRVKALLRQYSISMSHDNFSRFFTQSSAELEVLISSKTFSMISLKTCYNLESVLVGKPSTPLHHGLECHVNQDIFLW